MAKIKYDGVLEAAHYLPDGQLDWVRVYERRGPVFSDRLIIRRAEFIAQLKAGKRYVVGERIHYMGAKFNVGQPVYLQEKDGKQVLMVGPSQPGTGELAGVPVI